MNTDLMKLTSTAAQLRAKDAAVREYVEAGIAENTRRAYASDWYHFTSWCVALGLEALPASPETIARYIVDLVEVEGRKPATVRRRMAAIATAHKASGYEPPTSSPLVRSAWRGIARVLGTEQDAKDAIVTSDIREMVLKTPATLAGLRDRALLLVGFAGAFRRSELVALTAEDVVPTPEGLKVRIRRSKTDQEGEGAVIGIPKGRHPETCPVLALGEWQRAAGIASGPLFRAVDKHGNVSPRTLTGTAVALIVKRAAERAGFDPERFAGHSLRAGLATSAAAAGASERAIMKQTRHRSAVMVRRYIRDGELFRENAAASAGL